MLLRIDAQARETFQVKLLNIVRRGLEHHLILVVVLHAVGIFAVPAVSRPTAGLHIGRAPRFRPERPKKRRGMKGAGAHLDIVGLMNHTTMIGPEPMECEDEFLEGHEQSNVVRAVRLEKKWSQKLAGTALDCQETAGDQ